MVQRTVQEVIEAERDEAHGAAKGASAGECRGYRSGCYGRKLPTRVGTRELRVPQNRGSLFRTEVFARCLRSEKVRLLALAEMYVQGVSTRKGRAVTEEPSGHGFSTSSVSALTVQFDAELMDDKRAFPVVVRRDQPNSSSASRTAPAASTRCAGNCVRNHVRCFFTSARVFFAISAASCASGSAPSNMASTSR